MRNRSLLNGSFLSVFVLLLLVAPFGWMQAAPAHRAPGSARLLADFRKAFARPRVPLDAQIVSSETRDGLLHEKVTVASEVGVRVPLLIVTRAGDTARRPAVVCLHGLGGRKEDFAGPLEEFARRGFVGVALDARYHGDRGGDLTRAMIDSYRNGKEHPYLWDTVWDTWRVLDYLQNRPDVDRNRLGVTGISLGGHTTWMVSADPRVKVAVPMISVCSWRWQLAHQGYGQRVRNLQGAFDAVRDDLGEKEVTPKVVAAAWERWMPGIPGKYDCQDILGAMAPRPLLILGGDSDPVAPIEGAREAYDVIAKAYRDAGAADHLQMIIAAHSGHAVTAEHWKAMYAWFERWLKPNQSDAAKATSS
jgi:pimeloyl-ACP methyl ester carboxylesterase